MIAAMSEPVRPWDVYEDVVTNFSNNVPRVDEIANVQLFSFLFDRIIEYSMDTKDDLGFDAPERLVPFYARHAILDSQLKVKISDFDQVIIEYVGQFEFCGYDLTFGRADYDSSLRSKTEKLVRHAEEESIAWFVARLD